MHLSASRCARVYYRLRWLGKLSTDSMLHAVACARYQHMLSHFVYSSMEKLVHHYVHVYYAFLHQRVYGTSRSRQASNERVPAVSTRPPIMYQSIRIAIHQFVRSC